MTMTKRQREFLCEVVSLHARTKEAVHYNAVAEVLGVSKWTAYDMLRRLERAGYLTTEYQLGSVMRLRGRSKVLFAPTDEAVRVVESQLADERRAADNGTVGEADEDVSLDEWSQLRTRLLRLLKQVPKMGLTSVRDQLWREARRADEQMSPVAFCASTIAVLTAHAESVGKRGRGTLFDLVRRAPLPDLGLSIFAGTAVGMLVRKADARKWSRQIAEDVARYQQHLSRFTGDQKQILYEFLQDALVTTAFHEAG